MSKLDVQKEKRKMYQMLTWLFSLSTILLFNFTAFVEMKEQIKWAMLTLMIIFAIPAFIFG